MKHKQILVVAALLLLPAIAQAQQTQLPPATIASVVDREVSSIEKQILDTAEAMPEEKFNFSPVSLNISGAEYKGVRTFAEQLKHVAASNYYIWSPITGDKFREDLNDGKGPENVRSKADIIKFLKESFALGHKAAASLTPENMLQTRRTANRRACVWSHSACPTPTIITDRWWSICG